MTPPPAAEQTTPWVEGRVLLVADRGALHTCRLTSPPKGPGPLRVEDAEGDARALPRPRVFWATGTRLADAAALAAHGARAVEAAAALDLQACWEALAAGNALAPGAPEQVAAAAGLDATDPLAVEALVRASFADPERRFRMKSGQLQPASRAAREEAQRQAEAARAAARELELGGQRLRERLEAPGGTLRPEAAEGVEAASAAERLLDALEDLAVFGADAERATRARQVLDLLGRPSGPGAAAEVARALLVRLGRFSPDENLMVRRAGIPRGFSGEALDDARAQAGRAPEHASPRAADLTRLDAWAIDDAETTEVDDAFALQGERIWVLISDVAARVRRASPLEATARERLATVYLPEGKLPMLPAELSDRAASLTVGEVRPVLAFGFELGDRGQPVGFEVREALVRLRGRLTYEQADALLAGDDEALAGVTPESPAFAPPAAGEAREALRALLRGAESRMGRHRDHREEGGALLLERFEIRVHIGADGRVEIVRHNANGRARQLVAELMVAACSGTATWCQDHGVPCIYRAQARPDGPYGQPRPGGGRIQDPAERLAVLRRLKPTQLTTKPAPHFTLGVDCYTQVTSPIRRFGDLVMHQQLKAVRATGRPRYSRGELEALFERIDKGMGRIRRVENDTRRFWTLRHLEQRMAAEPGATWPAHVLRELGGRRVLLEVGALGLQTPHVPERPLRPGDALTVTVAEVDAASDTLRLRVVR